MRRMRTFYYNVFILIVFVNCYCLSRINVLFCSLNLFISYMQNFVVLRHQNIHFKVYFLRFRFQFFDHLFQIRKCFSNGDDIVGISKMIQYFAVDVDVDSPL